MRKIAIAAAAMTFPLFAGAGAAMADGCSGHDHDTGTIVGAAGGAAIVGLATHSIAGAVIGGVVGGVAGNAVARNEDCDHQTREENREDRQQAYDAGRADQEDRDETTTDEARQRAYDANRDERADRDANRTENSDRRADENQYPQ